MDTFKKSNSNFTKHDGKSSESVSKNYRSIKNKLEKESGRKLSKKEKEDALLGASLLTTHDIHKKSALEITNHIKRHKQKEKKLGVLGLLNPFKAVPYFFKKLILKPVLSVLGFVIKAPLRLMRYGATMGLIGLTNIATFLATQMAQIFFLRINSFNTFVYKLLRHTIIPHIMNGIYKVGAVIKTGKDAILGVIKKGVGFALGVLNNGLHKVFINPFMKVWGLVTKTFNGFCDFIHKLLHKGVEILLTGLDYIKKGFQITLDGTKKILSLGINKFKNWIKNKFLYRSSGKERLYVRLWKSFKNWGANKLEKVRELLGKLQYAKRYVKVMSKWKVRKAIQKFGHTKLGKATKWTFDKLLKLKKLPGIIGSILGKLKIFIKKFPIIGAIISAFDLRDCINAYNSGDSFLGTCKLNDFLFSVSTALLGTGVGASVLPFTLGAGVILSAFLIGKVKSKYGTVESEQAENELKNIPMWNFIFKPIFIQAFKTQAQLEKELQDKKKNDAGFFSTLWTIIKLQMMPMIQGIWAGLKLPVELGKKFFPMIWDIISNEIVPMILESNKLHLYLEQKTQEAQQEGKKFKAFMLDLADELSIIATPVIWTYYGLEWMGEKFAETGNKVEKDITEVIGKVADITSDYFYNRKVRKEAEKKRREKRLKLLKLNELNINKSIQKNLIKNIDNSVKSVVTSQKWLWYKLTFQTNKAKEIEQRIKKEVLDDKTNAIILALRKYFYTEQEKKHKELFKDFKASKSPLFNQTESNKNIVNQLNGIIQKIDKIQDEIKLNRYTDEELKYMLSDFIEKNLYNLDIFVLVGKKSYRLKDKAYDFESLKNYLIRTRNEYLLELQENDKEFNNLKIEEQSLMLVRQTFTDEMLGIKSVYEKKEIEEQVKTESEMGKIEQLASLEQSAFNQSKAIENKMPVTAITNEIKQSRKKKIIFGMNVIDEMNIGFLM